MNGADVADAEFARSYLDTLRGYVDWVEESLRGRGDLTEFEKDAYSKACKIQEM